MGAGTNTGPSNPEYMSMKTDNARLTPSDTRVFHVTVRHMPAGHTFTVRVLADTLENAKRKAITWDNYSAPGAHEYLTLA